MFKGRIVIRARENDDITVRFESEFPDSQNAKNCTHDNGITCENVHLKETLNFTVIVDKIFSYLSVDVSTNFEAFVQYSFAAFV